MAIVATLAAMFLPALQSAKKRLYAVQCINNLRNIGAASALYLNDWDNYPYFQLEQNVGGVPAVNWYDQLLPYLVHGEYGRVDYPAQMTIRWQVNGEFLTNTYIKNRWAVYQCPAAPKPSTTKYAFHYAGNIIVGYNPSTPPWYEVVAPNGGWATERRAFDLFLASGCGGKPAQDNNPSFIHTSVPTRIPSISYTLFFF